MKPIRVGIIGCGEIAQSAHIPAYIENPKARLVALCDVNKELLDKVANKFQIANRFVDYRELLKSNLVDAVSICTHTATHSEIAIETAGYDIHILCEKPLASSMQEAAKLAKAVNESRIKFMIGYNYRFLPNHIMTKKYMDNGRIGQPIFVRGEVVTAGPYRPNIDEKTYSFEVKKRIGAFFDLGSHIVDLLVWMFGQPEEVYATFSTYKNEVGVDDSAMALIRFKSNVIGSISVCWLNLPDYQSVADTRKIEIVGTTGKIDSEFFGPSLFFYSSDSISSKIKGKVKITPVKFNPKVPDEGLKLSYRREIDCFLDSIIMNKPPPITLEHGVNVLRLVTAAYDSARLRSPISMG